MIEALVVRRWWEVGWLKLTELLRRGYLHIILSVLFVQGFAYLSQICLARLLLPEQLGIVRSVEAVFVTLLSAVSCGFPSLITALISQVPARAQQRALLRRFFGLGLMLGLGFVAASLVARPYLVSAGAVPYFSILVLTLPLAALVRLQLGYLQGLREFRLSATANSVVAATLLAILLVATREYHLEGWVWSRVIGEILFFCVCVVLVRKVSSGGVADESAELSDRFRSALLLQGGSSIALSMVVRNALDNFAVFFLSWRLGVSPSLGYISLATLLLQGALLPLGAFAVLYTPEFGAARAQAERFSSLVRKALAMTFFTSLGVVLLVFIGAQVLTVLFGEAYLPTKNLLMVLSLALPFRAMTSILGIVVVILDRSYLTTVINMIGLAVAFLVSSAWWGTLDPLASVATGILVAECVSFILYLLVYRSTFRGDTVAQGIAR